MLPIVTSIHDPLALTTTCRRLHLSAPQQTTIQFGNHAVSGWIIRLRGTCHPIVWDPLTGLVKYHPLDNAHDRYASIMRFLHHCYEVQAQLQRERNQRISPKPVRRQLEPVHAQSARRQLLRRPLQPRLCQTG